MDLRLFNSLSNKKEVFVPNKGKEVSMYVCGSTVYDSPHIGNLRPIVAFDVLRRLLIYLGYEVTYVSNFTDIDDKIIKKAIKENVTEMDIANRYIKEINELIDNINSMRPTYSPRVSEYIDKIISYIDKLIKSNHAYKLDNDVYFRVSSIPNYGVLSNISTEDLKVGARVNENEKKESPFDFALWKSTNEGIKFDSPFGLGRPGWHTECVVMIDSIFNHNMIDIHGGGFDLKFPHHENEIAQNKAMNGNNLAKYWVHNGFVTFDDNKMSKSLGNVILAKDAINKYGSVVTRLALLSSHYRAPVKFNDETISMAINEVNKIKQTLLPLSVYIQRFGLPTNDFNELEIDGFIDALKDDLNVSNALAFLFNRLKDVNTLLRSKDKDLTKLSIYYLSIKKMLSILGLKIDTPLLTDDDKNLLNLYDKAREEKNYEESDRIRKILIERNIF